uniref:Uncharacterized protein n=1 Tax=Rhabditophanes sp. KR3021 TaxID=114890 RepID=A0AC35TRF2_9BILA
MFAPLPVDTTHETDDSVCPQSDNMESLNKHFNNCEALYRVRVQYRLNLEEICRDMSKGMEVEMMAFFENTFYPKLQLLAGKPLRNDIKRYLIKLLTESPVVKIYENSVAITLAGTYFTDGNKVQCSDLVGYQGPDKADKYIKALLDKKAELTYQKIFLKQSPNE